MAKIHRLTTLSMKWGYDNNECEIEVNIEDDEVEINGDFWSVDEFIDVYSDIIAWVKEVTKKKGK